MQTIQGYLSKNNYRTLPDSTYTHIDEWLEWYRGSVDAFHSYNFYNGIQVQKATRLSLGMAKRVCEDWANLLLNEKVKITTSSESLNQIIEHVMEYNNFKVRANQLIELIFALGTGALVEYQDGTGEIVVDYIRADMIYPLSWENGDITECAFGSHKSYDGKEYIYLQIHELEENGSYVIHNHYIDENSGDELPLDELGIEERIETGSSVPCFQIITPNIVNNIDLDSPMGISCYGNSIDQLKSTDLVYDSYANEFILGKKRITVPMSMAKIEMSGKQGARPVFDAKDTVFYAIPNSSDGNNELKEIDMKLRAAEHELGLQKNLDLLSFKCGLGNDRYSFDGSGVKTATEVISDKSELFQNLKKHQIPVRSGLVGMIKAIASLLNISEDKLEVTIDFDDSIIEDKAAERNQDRQDLAAGIMSAVEYRMKWYNEDAETAAAALPGQADIME